ncbi:hypothetical protein B0H14DRAFT_2624115 [Mycena olivaceomarginata]|nr:hypothetical protein B0H14DRAFT_2624115 [Mycena olivaceomarginata]
MSLSELLAIVTRVKTKRTRHCKGDNKAKPGKESWVYGTKKTFFEKRKQEWLRESEANRAGPFYTKVAKLYFKKYGYHLEDDQDFAVDITDPPDSAADDIVHEMLSPEKVMFWAECVAKLRMRIGAWYRAELHANQNRQLP